MICSLLMQITVISRSDVVMWKLYVGLNLGIRLLLVSVPRVWNGPMILLCLTRAGIRTGSRLFGRFGASLES